MGDGKKVNRDGFGTRVTVRQGDKIVSLREQKSSRGTYNSTDTRVLHFGLGDGVGDGGRRVAGQDVTFVCWRVFRRGLAAPPAPAAGGHCPPDPLNYGSTAGLGLERAGLAAVDELAIGL